MPKDWSHSTIAIIGKSRTAKAMQPVDIEHFTWTNLHADVYLGLHANATNRYLETVVAPALNAIEAQCVDLAGSEDPTAAFALSNVEHLQRATLEAFALAIQSLSERQSREFSRPVRAS